MIYFQSYLRYCCALLICAWKINDIGFKGVNRPELQIKGGIKDNSMIIFLISQ